VVVVRIDVPSIFVASVRARSIASFIIGYIATRVHSQQTLLLAGLAVGAFFAFLIAAIPQPDGTHYWWQIMLPGSVLGLIVGYATQRYGKPARAAS